MPILVRDMWRRAGRSLSGLEAVRETLAGRGRSFAGTYASFAAANRRTHTAYAEGRAQKYPNAPLRDSFALSPSNRRRASTGTLDHLSSATVRFVPGSGLRAAGQKLRLQVRMAPRVRGSKLVITTYYASGRVSVRKVALNPRGDLNALAAFRTGTITRVEATLVNSSSRLGRVYNDQRAKVTGVVL